MKFLFLLCLPLCAQSFRAAESAYLVGSVADVVSSRGLVERNPILGGGQFGARQAVTSLAISAGTVFAAELVVRKWPKMRRTMAVVMFAMGGVRGGVAVHNSIQQGK